MLQNGRKPLDIVSEVHGVRFNINSTGAGQVYIFSLMIPQIFLTGEDGGPNGKSMKF